MDNMTDFVNKAGKSNQPAIEITGRRSDDWKFDLLNLLDWGLRVSATILFCLFAWWLA